MTQRRSGSEEKNRRTLSMAQGVKLDDAVRQDIARLIKEGTALTPEPSPVTLVIDPEFQSLIPPLTTEERGLLEDNLLAEGCRDALVI
jgi:hypothetical protein